MRARCDNQAVVWDAIERMAFRPVTGNDRNRWLAVYERSLPRLWGRQATDIQIRRNQGFDVDFLSIACNYSVEDPDRYSVTIVNAAANTPACWYLHVDPDYCSRSSFYRPDEDYPTQAMAASLEHDVKTVLDGMIFHPRNHAHGNELGIVSELAAEVGALDESEIRLGGGVENAFVFLTHLRFQLCLLSDNARQAERRRLISLFTMAITNRSASIPPAELFDLQAR